MRYQLQTLAIFFAGLCNVFFLDSSYAATIDYGKGTRFSEKTYILSRGRRGVTSLVGQVRVKPLSILAPGGTPSWNRLLRGDPRSAEWTFIPQPNLNEVFLIGDYYPCKPGETV
jgi:hypothetical protein